ncbi:NAD(P)-dependent oxidoreductase [Arthrobacter sp. zg-Y179]|uniref:NAD(P)-dependent oxidoreductase n=1 Tax=Arthrobacter sp. zg-Y179 TaxID=2894188 RepID=UPI001E3D8E6E|nr:NAD(P)-binding oxidoreductase [Arthrobacter sp. zg-Y179]MCC9173235.1 SDR family oxidoreductase [Arthrobacter sp. zg-Y179]
MRITIIGGSQGTGAQLAFLAQAAGHEVTVLSRSGRAPSGVSASTGDATNPETVSAAVSGADAVVVTVGGAKGVPHQRAAVTRAVVKAMQAQGVRRLVVQSSLGAGDSSSQLPGPLGLITRVALAKPLADHNEQESAVTGSGLDWTLVRPTGLTDKDPAGTWRALEVGGAGKLRGSIPRRDLAVCMLEILTDDSTVGKALGVSS